MKLLTTVALFALSVSQMVFAVPCIAFDADWNLYAFGFNGKDYNAGTQDKWTGSASTFKNLCIFLNSSLSSVGNKATDATASGRP